MNNSFNNFDEEYFAEPYEADESGDCFDSEFGTVETVGLDPMSVFSDQMAGFGVLSKERTFALIEQARRGDDFARETIVNHNMGLVVKIARKYVGRGIDLDDLVTAGYEGIDKAIDKFDPKKGAFSTLCGVWINHYIGRFIENYARCIKLPSGVSEALTKLYIAQTKLTNTLNRTPSVEDLSAATGFTVSRVKELREISAPVLSLDDVIGDDDFTLGDTITDDTTDVFSDVGNKAFLYDCLERGFKALNITEKTVLAKSFGVDNDTLGISEDKTTATEIASELGISVSRVKEIKEDALSKLRDYCDFYLAA